MKCVKDMSKIIKWQYSDFFEPRREKLVSILLSEIIFLKSHIKKSNISKKNQYLEILKAHLIWLDMRQNTLGKEEKQILS